MLTSLGSFLQVASAVLVITSLAGVGLMRARVANLADRVNDLRGEVADKDRHITELKAARETDLVERERYRSDLAALKRNLTGEAHWIAIGRKLDAHEDLLGRILQALSEGKP